MRTIADQLLEAFERTGLSVPELLALTDLDLDRSSLLRKLRGDVPWRTDEAEAVIEALRKHGLDARIVYPPVAA